MNQMSDELFPRSSYGHLMTKVKQFIREGKLKFKGRVVDHLEIDDLDIVLFKIYGISCDRSRPSLSINRFERLCAQDHLLDWVQSENAFSIFKAKLAQSGVVWDADHEPDFSGLTQAAS